MVIIIVCVEMGKTNTETRKMMVLITPTGRTTDAIMVTMANLSLGINQDKIVSILVMTAHKVGRKGIHQVEEEDLVQG